MKKNNFPIVFALIFSAALISVSCSTKKTIEFDDSDPLALATDIEWAVIKDPYVAYRTEPGFENEVMNYGRIGDVEMVLGKKVLFNEDSEIVWYEFDKGWMDQSGLTVYDNKLKAKSASEKLLK